MSKPDDEQERQPGMGVTATITNYPDDKMYTLEEFKATLTKALAEADTAIDLLNGVQHRISSLAIVMTAGRCDEIKPEFARTLRQSFVKIAASVGSAPLCEMDEVTDMIEKLSMILDSHITIRPYTLCEECRRYHVPQDPMHGMTANRTVPISGIGLMQA